MDVNGRVTSDRLGALDPTTYAYDPLGRMTSTTAPPTASPIVTSFTYNGFGQTKTMVEFATSSAPATTTYAYDAAGRLDSVDGPRTDATDTTSYDYDLAGRLTIAKQEGITLPGAGSPGVTTTLKGSESRFAPRAVRFRRMLGCSSRSSI
jgi:YD repeat-containing protein